MKIEFPKLLNNKQLENFFINIGLKRLVVESKKKIPSFVDDRRMSQIQPPDLKDLYRLYMFIVLNNRTTVLEFGTGYSTLVMHLALLENQRRFGKIKPFQRCEYPYTLFSLDNNKKYMNISKKRVGEFSKKKNKIKFFYSSTQMTLYQGNFAVEFKNLPLVNPDFIYLDGPSQWGLNSRINNFTTAHPDMMPMSCDIAKIENFLTPGTIIVSDGRTANSIFLKNIFKRKWKFKRDEKNDQCYFQLIDLPLGKLNLNQLKFYRKKR